MFIALLLTICLPTSLLAATLSGIVKEDTTALSDVEVMLVKKDSGIVVTRDYTGKNGAFRFTVKSGIYDVGAFKFDYNTEWIRDVSIGDENIKLEFQLEPTAFSEDASISVDCE